MTEGITIPKKEEEFSQKFSCIAISFLVIIHGVEAQKFF